MQNLVCAYNQKEANLRQIQKTNKHIDKLEYDISLAQDGYHFSLFRMLRRILITSLACFFIATIAFILIGFVIILFSDFFSLFNNDKIKTPYYLNIIGLKVMSFFMPEKVAFAESLEICKEYAMQYKEGEYWHILGYGLLGMMIVFLAASIIIGVIIAVMELVKDIVHYNVVKIRYSDSANLEKDKKEIIKLKASAENMLCRKDELNKRINFLEYECGLPSNCKNENSVKNLLQYIESGRADSVKEALWVQSNDNHNARMEREAQRAADEVERMRLEQNFYNSMKK